jgi:hypothetical protein
MQLKVTDKVLGGSLSLAVLNIVSSIVVHAIEIVGAQYKGLLLRCECREAITKLGTHRGWVISKVDRVGKPGDSKLDLTVGSLDILRVLGVPGVCGVTVEGDSNLTTILGLELLTVNLYSAAMSNEKVVANDPRLGGRVTNVRLVAVRAATGSVRTGAVTKNG